MTNNELTEAITLAKRLADSARMDWLESQSCWIGIYGDIEIKSKRQAGGIYCTTVRDACDSLMTKEAQHDRA